VSRPWARRSRGAVGRGFATPIGATVRQPCLHERATRCKRLYQHAWRGRLARQGDCRAAAANDEVFGALSEGLRWRRRGAHFDWPLSGRLQSGASTFGAWRARPRRGRLRRQGVGDGRKTVAGRLYCRAGGARPPGASAKSQRPALSVIRQEPHLKSAGRCPNKRSRP